MRVTFQIPCVFHMFVRSLFVKVVFGVSERPLWDTAADPADPPVPVDPVSEPGLGPSLPHAPGARMTVV